MSYQIMPKGVMALAYTRFLGGWIDGVLMERVYRLIEVDHKDWKDAEFRQAFRDLKAPLGPQQEAYAEGLAAMREATGRFTFDETELEPLLRLPGPFKEANTALING